MTVTTEGRAAPAPEVGADKPGFALAVTEPAARHLQGLACRAGQHAIAVVAGRNHCFGRSQGRLPGAASVWLHRKAGRQIADVRIRRWHPAPDSPIATFA